MPRSPAARASNLLSRFPCFYTIDSQPWVSKAASGTADVNFVPLFREEELDSTYNHWQQYQSIVFQAPYQDHSFEELRVADYARTAPGQSEPGCKGDTGASETKPAPTAAASILSLPEELVFGITNHLQLKDLRAFRLANHKLAQASSYAIAQHMPLDKHIRLTETGLRSFLPVTRNREVARRISTLCVDGRFLVADTTRGGCAGLEEHECRAYPGLADCPVRIERDVVDGCSETLVRLLAEMFRNLQNLRRVELRGFPVSVADGADGDGSGQSFRAWCPMSSWPFRSVVAALRAGGTHVPELIVREAMYSEGVKAVLEPPPTEACPPSCELGAMPWLKSLDIGVMNVLDLKDASRHASMFRYMRALLSAAAPSVEKLAISSGSDSRREVVQGLVGGGMLLPRLKELVLTCCQMTFRDLKELVLAHAATLELVQLESCVVVMDSGQAEEMRQVLEERGIGLRVAGSLAQHFGLRDAATFVV